MHVPAHLRDGTAPKTASTEREPTLNQICPEHPTATITGGNVPSLAKQTRSNPLPWDSRPGCHGVMADMQHNAHVPVHTRDRSAPKTASTEREPTLNQIRPEHPLATTRGGNVPLLAKQTRPNPLPWDSRPGCHGVMLDMQHIVSIATRRWPCGG